MLSVREPGESILWQHGFARCPRAGQSIPVKKWNSLQGKQLHYKCFGGIKWLRQSSAPEFTKNTLRAFLHICCRQIVCNDVILKVNDGYYGVIYTAEVPVGFFFTVLSVQRDKTLKYTLCPENTPISYKTSGHLIFSPWARAAFQHLHLHHGTPGQCDAEIRKHTRNDCQFHTRLKIAIIALHIEAISIWYCKYFRHARLCST